MYKKALLLFMAGCISITLCGCLNSIKLNEQAIVQAVSLDLIDGKISVGLQIFSPTNNGSNNITASPDNAVIVEGVGDTITQAIENSMLKQGKKIFLGHNRIIIIGKDLAESGLQQTLKYFSINPMSRKSVSIALADGKAIDLVSAKLAQGILPAQTLENIIDNTNKTGYAENILMYEFERSLQNRNECALLPVLKQVKKQDEKPPEDKQGQEDKGAKAAKEDEEKKISEVSNIGVAGCGIIVDGKLVRILDNEHTRGLLWLRKKVQKTRIVTETDVFSLSAVNVYKVDTKITPLVEGENISFDMKVNCSATLGETHLRNEAVENDIKGVQIAAEKKIKEECDAAFADVIVKDRADICNYGAMVWQNNVELWRKIKDDWRNEVSKIKLNVTVHVDIDSVGLEFNKKK